MNFLFFLFLIFYVKGGVFYNTSGYRNRKHPITLLLCKTEKGEVV